MGDYKLYLAKYAFRMVQTPIYDGREYIERDVCGYEFWGSI
jgi:hypothetical protein